MLIVLSSDHTVFCVFCFHPSARIPFKTIRVHGYEVVCALTRDGLFVYVI
jgi:hypothetical protein